MRSKNGERKGSKTREQNQEANMGVSKTKPTKTKWGSKNVERNGERICGAKFGSKIGSKNRSKTTN